MNTDTIFEWDTDRKRNNSDLFPDIFRCLIVGESNCVKTSLLLKYLLENSPLGHESSTNLLDYNYLIIYSDSLFQPKYQILKKGFDSKLNQKQLFNFFKNKNIFKNCELNEDRFFKEHENLVNKIESSRSEPSVIVEYYNSNEKIPDPSELQDNKKYIVIFDDCITVKNQDIMKSYFTRGRHKNVIVFYLSQSYFSLDRRSIRMNSNLLILFKLSNLDLQNLHRDRIQIDMSLAEFTEFCNNIWENDYNYVFINFDEKPKTGRRYRHNLENFYIPIKYR